MERIKEDFVVERTIQDGFAKTESRVLTFESDESLAQVVGAMLEIVQSGGNGHISLESVLRDR